MSSAPDEARRAERGSKLLVLLLAGVFLFGMLGFALAVIDTQSGPAPTEPPPPSLPALPGAEAAEPRILLAVAEVEPTPTLDSMATAEPAASPSTGPALSVGPSPSAEIEPGADLVALSPSRLPVVAVTGFWSKREGLSSRDVVRALRTGSTRGFDRVFVDEAIADRVAEELDVAIHADVRRAGADRIARAASKGALGLVAASEVTPAMRMLDLDDRSLVGVERIERTADWPLSIAAEPGEAGWDQGGTWVLVAGGDSFTDRGVYDTVVRKGKGVDYPFDGGTARVTGHGCCDPVFNDNIVPRYVLTGNKGAVRKLFKEAELAIANHEQPVTEAAAFHRSGTRFSGKPELTRIFSRAGIDYLSLANNHIGDYGADGIRDTRRILRKHDIAFGGAGKDLGQARKVDLLEVGDAQVAIIPCLDIVRIYWAADAKAGATPCVDQYIKKDIRKARRAGADVIIVFPHWGVEYTRQPLDSMRKHAARWVDAGATLVLGAHSHVAGSIEDIDGVPVLYSLGNLIFDQHWSTNTMESALLEATFHGDRLVEMRLRPYIIHDTSQPNLLDPAKGEGRRLLKEMKAASSRWLDW